jgi:hypothetical protein
MGRVYSLNIGWSSLYAFTHIQNEKGEKYPHTTKLNTLEALLVLHMLFENSRG